MSALGRSIGGYFFSVSFVPSAVLVYGIWALFTMQAGPVAGTSTGSVLQRVSDADAASLLLLSALVLILALLTHPFQVNLVKVVEGYSEAWFLKPLMIWGRARHARAHHRLRQQLYALQQARNRIPATFEDQPDVARILDRWNREGDHVLEGAVARVEGLPRIDRLMPTRLGNALRAAEDTAGDRYGMPGVLLSAHLALVGPDASAQMADYQTTLERQLRLAVSFFLLSCVAVIAFIDDGPWLFVAPLLGSAALAAYSGAVEAGRFYGAQACLIADMHRLDLLEKMGYPEPTGPDDERELLAILGRQVRGRPTDRDIEILNERLRPTSKRLMVSEQHTTLVLNELLRQRVQRSS